MPLFSVYIVLKLKECKLMNSSQMKFVKLHDCEAEYGWDLGNSSFRGYEYLIVHTKAHFHPLILMTSEEYYFYNVQKFI